VEVEVVEEEEGEAKVVPRKQHSAATGIVASLLSVF
jgi:hypothetical protein